MTKSSPNKYSITIYGSVRDIQSIILDHVFSGTLDPTVMYLGGDTKGEYIHLDSPFGSATIYPNRHDPSEEFITLAFPRGTIVPYLTKNITADQLNDLVKLSTTRRVWRKK